MLKQVNYIGKDLEGYRITTELEAGPASRMFLGETVTSPKQYVAIKRLYVPHRDAQWEEAFLQEIHFFQSLQHSHILPVITVGVDKDSPYIISEFTPGSVYKLMQRHASLPLPLDETCTIISQIGQALDYAHRQNVLHGKLTPTNILINARGQAVLNDFLLTSFPAIDSSDHIDDSVYIAPEQLAGTPSLASDQYSLACVTYEMLTGRKPYVVPAPDNPEGYQKTTTLVPPTQLNPALPQSVEEALLKALEPNPAQRYSDITTFVVALGTYDELSNLGSVPPVLQAPSEESEEQKARTDAMYIAPVYADGATQYVENDGQLLDSYASPYAVENELPYTENGGVAATQYSSDPMTPHPAYSLSPVQAGVANVASSSWKGPAVNKGKPAFKREWILVALACVLVVTIVGGISAMAFSQQQPPAQVNQPTPTTDPTGAPTTENTPEEATATATTAAEETPSPATTPTATQIAQANVPVNTPTSDPISAPTPEPTSGDDNTNNQNNTNNTTPTPEANANNNDDQTNNEDENANNDNNENTENANNNDDTSGTDENANDDSGTDTSEPAPEEDSKTCVLFICW